MAKSALNLTHHQLRVLSAVQSQRAVARHHDGRAVSALVRKGLLEQRGDFLNVTAAGQLAYRRQRAMVGRMGAR